MNATPANGVVSKEERCAILKAHNDARANVAPAANPALVPLEWDDNLARVAYSYSQQCQGMNHSPDASNGTYGENLWAGTAGAYQASDAVNSWVNEKNIYDYASNSCSGVCGHYTQVVWRETTKVGCGYTNCSGSILFVCNYSPTGNVNVATQRPY